MATILITGAGSGIGRAAARVFLHAGWTVGLIGRRAEALEETAAGEARAILLPADVTDPAAVDTAFSRFAETAGRLDVLFNNAGITVRNAPVDEIPVEDWLRLCNTNITGMFLCARAAFGQMRRQSPQGGRIINNGSISAQTPRPNSAPYTATKHAITGLTKSTALDGRHFDIACGQIDIGNADTEMALKMKSGILQAHGAIAVEATIDVEYVANAVVHMASLPLEANVLFMTVMATKMPLVGRG